MIITVINYEIQVVEVSEQVCNDSDFFQIQTSPAKSDFAAIPSPEPVREEPVVHQEPLKQALAADPEEEINPDNMPKRKGTDESVVGGGIGGGDFPQ
jgi:hypothetical protein